MKRASVIVGLLLGFLLVHWAVAAERAAFIQAQQWHWGSSAPTLVLVPEPSNEVPKLDFDPREHLLPGEELILSDFALALSVAEMNAVRRDMYREETARLRAARGPVPPVLVAMVAAITDPFALLIGVAAGWLAFASVSGALRAPVVGVAAAAAGIGASELILQAQQYFRPVEQTIVVEITVVGAFLAAVGINWLVSRRNP